MKRALKIAAVVSSMALMILAATIIAFVLILPQPSTLGKFIRGELRSEQRDEQNSGQNSGQNIGQHNRAAHEDADPNPTRSSKPPELLETKQDPVANASELNQKLIDRYLKPTRLDERICDGLSRLSPEENHKAPSEIRSVQDLNQQIQASLIDDSFNSPELEAIMLPLVTALRNDSVRELLKFVQDSAEKGATTASAERENDFSFLERAEFAGLLAKASLGLMQSHTDLERVSERSYRLLALSRAVAHNPEMLRDPEALEFCRGLERSAINQLAIDDRDAKSRLEKLLARHGVDAKDIHYEANLLTGVSIESSTKGIQVRIPWMEHTLGLNQPAASLTSPPAQPSETH